jgi:hypothetical protein
MRKIGLVVAALGAAAVVLPSIASADTVVIKKKYHRPFDARAEYREHRGFGMHEGFRHRDNMVVIKHRHGFRNY